MNLARRAAVLAILAGALSCTSASTVSTPPVSVPQLAAPAPELEPYRADVEALVREALVNGQSYALLSDLCRTAPKRLSASAGAARAVEWGERTMRAIGLSNVRLEPVLVPHWERGETESLRVLDAAGLPQERLSLLALGGSVATPPGGVSAEVMVVTSFEELRARAAQARGKIVLFNRPMDPAQHDCFAAYGGAVDQRSRGASEASRVGARAALVRSMTMALDDHPHTGAMRYDIDVEPLPAAALSTLAADRLAARVAAGERVSVNLQLSCRTLPDVLSHNVVGEIPGTGVEREIVVVGGHLDAWDVGHGAHDDGAGCAHSLEAARLILARGHRPRRTIRVVLFMNEENGARGAEAYYKGHIDELERHVLALESDAGGFTPRGFATNANPRAFESLRAIVELLDAASANALRVGGGGVDIGPLANAGVPLVGFRPDDERYFDHHHCERDTLDSVHPRELALGSGAIAGLLHVIANLPQPLPRNPQPDSAPSR
ncbi:MAG: M20/M25/M40 family metallo-hydrolase [Planctomycetes bacterium]|nr:M20/M25/M40 family metallo-hydrolase [Planctomycetota bacterium]